MVKLQYLGSHMCKRSGSLVICRTGFTDGFCKKFAFLLPKFLSCSFFPRLNFDCWLLSRAFLFDLLHAGLMTLDNFKCYSRMCIALKKVKDEWFKDERKIDGYREKKIRRNSQREAER